MKTSSDFIITAFFLGINTLILKSQHRQGSVSIFE